MESILSKWQEASENERNLIVIFNGPPGSGKDTIAELLREEEGFFHASFKTQLLNIVFSMVPFIDPKEWDHRYSDQQMKNMPWDKLGGLSQREFLIKVSEEWVKPHFGEQYFGILAANLVSGELTTFSDGGFDHEILGLLHETEKLEEESEILIIQLHRDGHDFSNDSRNYIGLEHPRVHYAKFDNAVQYSPEVKAYQGLSEEEHMTLSAAECLYKNDLENAEKQENLDRAYDGVMTIIEDFIDNYENTDV